MRRWLAGARGAVRPFVLVSGAVAASTVAVVIAATTGGGTAPAGTANVWVRTTGCTASPVRQSTPVTLAAAPSNAIACQPAQAVAAMNTGDTGRVVNGTYATRQDFDKDFASATRLIGESRAGVILYNDDSFTDCTGGGSAFDVSFICMDSTNLSLEQMTIDTNDYHYSTSGGRVGANNFTLRDVVMTGNTPALFVVADGFTWDGGYHGKFEQVGEERIGCGGDGEPINLSGDNATIRNLTVYPSLPDQSPCSGSPDGFHLEYFRVEGSSGHTWRNVNFWSKPGTFGDAGSGHVFLTGASTISNLTFINVRFGWAGGNYMTQSNGVTTCANFKFYYSRFEMPMGWGCSYTGSVWVGNVGVYPGCSGSGGWNVWQDPSVTSCGGHTSDTFVTGPAFVSTIFGGTYGTSGWNNLGLNATTGGLNAGSPAIDAAETPGASDACTDALIVGSVDISGTARPFGSRCDAGPAEYGG